MREYFVLASDNPEDAYKKDYHGHPKYIKIYLSLVLLLLATLIPNIVNWIAGETVVMAVWWVVALIFCLSLWKAMLVIRNFMHVKYEPLLIGGVMLFSFTALLALFVLIWPDVAILYDPSTTSDISTVKTNKVEHYEINGHKKSYEVINIKSTKTTRRGTIIKEQKFDFVSIDKHLH